jgi:glycerophosphoryl diester phosphodiesterase
MRRWKRKGYGLGVWTVDEASAALVLFENGADLVISNRPGRIRAAFE